MRNMYFLLIPCLLACQQGVITQGELTAQPYTLLVDTTGINELSSADQLLARAATAGRRTYIFRSDQKGIINSENGPTDGEHPFEWTLGRDSLHIVVVKEDGIQDRGYALSRKGKAIELNRGHYRAWLKPQ